MVREFALEPELVATWGTLAEARFYRGKFGRGTPRFVARYPKRWAAMVWEAGRTLTDLERKRLETLLAEMQSAMVKRADAGYDPEADWLVNAEREHRRRPFHAILARENPRSATCVLCGEIDEGTVGWGVGRTLRVARQLAPMTDVLGTLLSASSRAILIDPYWDPGRESFLASLAALVERALDGRSEAGRFELTLVVRSDHASARAYAEFRELCEARMTGACDARASVTVVRVGRRHGGEHLHNRFLLTDVGGVVVPAGFDWGTAGQFDDLALMETGHLDARMRDYRDCAVTFEVRDDEPPFVVRGTKGA